jgi:hypothetical protein
MLNKQCANDISKVEFIMILAFIKEKENNEKDRTIL